MKNTILVQSKKNVSINDFKYTQQSNQRKNIQSVNSKNNKRPNICVTEKYLKNNKEFIRNKKVVAGNRSYAETASYGKKNSHYWRQQCK